MFDITCSLGICLKIFNGIVAFHVNYRFIIVLIGINKKKDVKNYCLVLSNAVGVLHSE